MMLLTFYLAFDSFNAMDIKGIQVRAARALLNWSASDLARAAGVSLSTVQRTETGASEPVAVVKAAIVGALVAQGIEFVEGGARVLPREG
jgi:transcriptional regulator with XRE-family HTH domain